uniref:RING-type domain-containing protein n=1 Tax=viral metagenome TaxID=1070528 RepID=A0A6C0AN97_9ZZZZ
MPAVLTTKDTCIICHDSHSEPIIFNNTCKCLTVVHANCYNWYLRENKYKCPVCKVADVEPFALNNSDSSDCSSMLLCCFVI